MTVTPPHPRRRRAAAAAVLLGAALAGGCGSAAPPARSPAAPAVTAPLITSLTAADRQTWAIVVMGGSGQENKFWQLFTRPPGGTRWTLVTPPGVADNGGLITAVPAAGRPLDAAVRPSQGLTFSPLAATSDSGRTWTPGLLNARIADLPDALAASSGKLLALLGDGTIDQATPAGTGWSRLAGPGALAASPAGRECSVTRVTAVAVTASGTPLAGASCARPGTAGIFAYTSGSWQAAGPARSGRTAGQPVQVLRLTSTAAGNLALLLTNAGRQASLLAAWTSGSGARWTVSPPLAAGTGQILASGTGPAGMTWVLLPGGHAETISGPGATWRSLPRTPPGTAALAAGPGDTMTALAAAGNRLTIWQLAVPADAWTRTQAISVPIQYGSSA